MFLYRIAKGLAGRRDVQETINVTAERRDVPAASFGFAILLLRAYKGLAEYIEDRLCQTEVIVLRRTVYGGPQAASEAVPGPAVLDFVGFLKGGSV